MKGVRDGIQPVDEEHPEHAGPDRERQAGDRAAKRDPRRWLGRLLSRQLARGDARHQQRAQERRRGEDVERRPQSDQVGDAAAH
jgi:hypothetical protein